MHYSEGLQRNLNLICEAYQRAGLVVNMKTQVLSQLEKVALDGSVECAVRLRRDGVTMNFDL